MLKKLKQLWCGLWGHRWGDINLFTGKVRICSDNFTKTKVENFGKIFYTRCIKCGKIEPTSDKEEKLS